MRNKYFKMVHKENFSIGRQNIIACIWDFDRTLSPHYMQEPLFRDYGLDLEKFWEEVNALPEYYLKQGIKVSEDSIGQNHLITYVKSGLLPGLSNQKLREIGKQVRFFNGLPEFFPALKQFVADKYGQHNISLEHYIVSNGIAEIIRGSAIAPYVDGIFACEFIERPFSPGFLEDNDAGSVASSEISQIGTIVDNTHKTRCIFEINKGCNKDSHIKINSTVEQANRRIPIRNMIYIADGPSDIPAFTVVRQDGGLGFAVYNELSDAEFEQNDRMRVDDRIDAYGPADYTENSATVRWLKMHIKNICERIVVETDLAMQKAIGNPPSHLHDHNTTD